MFHDRQEPAASGKLCYVHVQASHMIIVRVNVRSSRIRLRAPPGHCNVNLPQTKQAPGSYLIAVYRNIGLELSDIHTYPAVSAQVMIEPCNMAG
jgi:hypothetical protein